MFVVKKTGNVALADVAVLGKPEQSTPSQLSGSRKNTSETRSAQEMCATLPLRRALHRAAPRWAEAAARGTPPALFLAEQSEQNQSPSGAGGVHHEVAPVAEHDGVRRVCSRRPAHGAEHAVIPLHGFLISLIIMMCPPP
jgi:hypothetical protein